MTREVAIVPHTHWDREWYSGFQTFRLQLVDLLDDLLPRLEGDPSYGHFLLDGQMAVVDDYLAMRPEAEATLRRLATSGRLAMGPWYILMDEFLVSGETMVRDLQMGLERAAAFGGAMEVGYLPDMFGHVAQMPQLLQQFGFDHAVVWRGVPSEVDRTGFWWEAPDGSTVRAEYLPEGYGNGAALPDDAKDLVAMIERFAGAHSDMLVGPILWMNGTDHQPPRPWLGRVVAEANDIQDDFRLRVTSLADYLKSAPTEGLASWKGELRSGARANLLMGVGSNRVDVKQRAAAAERGLERVAEPLCALHLPVERWPSAQLAEAWKLVVRNCAHDSVCACSIDEVCDAVIHRYDEARQIADGLTARAIAAIGTAAARGSTGRVVVNPLPRSRSGVIEVKIPGEGPIEGLQLLRQHPGDTPVSGITRAMCVQLTREAVDAWRNVSSAEAEVGDDGVLTVTIIRDPELTPRPWAGPIYAQVKALADEDPEGPAVFVLRRPPLRVLLARVADVPVFGWRTFEPEPLDVEPVAVAGTTVTNGLVTVAVNGADGTFAIDGLAGFGRMVDDGDVGDTYNYCPPAADTVVDKPERVEVEVIEHGPVQAKVRIAADYLWPRRRPPAGADDFGPVQIVTTLEVRAGERLVRVETEIDNQHRDHRLRAWFPLPEAATTSRAECAFAVVERGLEAEGGPTEPGLATYPSRRFVQAGGLTVVHDGLLEYELVDIADGAARQLALTLLRCTGMLSQGPMASRPLPAGPLIAMEGPQMLGRQVLRYALALGDIDPFAAADDAFTPLVLGKSWGGADAPRSAQPLSVEGAQVSTVARLGGRLLVRVFNPSDQPSQVSIEGRRGWLVDLRNRPIEQFEGHFDLGPWRIATALLTD